MKISSKCPTSATTSPHVKFVKGCSAKSTLTAGDNYGVTVGANYGNINTNNSTDHVRNLDAAMASLHDTHRGTS